MRSLFSCRQLSPSGRGQPASHTRTACSEERAAHRTQPLHSGLASPWGIHPLGSFRKAHPRGPGSGKPALIPCVTLCPPPRGVLQLEEGVFPNSLTSSPHPHTEQHLSLILTQIPYRWAVPRRTGHPSLPTSHCACSWCRATVQSSKDTYRQRSSLCAE